MRLRFCPSCGANLPQTAAVRYCPFCGQYLLRFAEVEQDGQAVPVGNLVGTKVPLENCPIPTKADLIRRYDALIANLKAKGLGEEEIRREGAALFAKLKAELPVCLKHQGKNNARNPELRQEPRECYSVVLKSCGDKERLAKRLSSVLRRGLAAIRMAVEMVPCVIIYKCNPCDLETVLPILEEEKLYYTILKGNFDFSIPVDQVIPGFADFDEQLRTMFQKLPSAFWLGEQVRLVVSEVWVRDYWGVMAVTDKGLYIFPDTSDGYCTEWTAIPYGALAEVVNHGEQSGELELVFKEYNREEWLKIEENELLEQAYEIIRQGLLQ